MCWSFESFDRCSDGLWAGRSRNDLQQAAQKPTRGQRGSDSSTTRPHLNISLSYCLKFQVEDILEQDVLSWCVGEGVTCGPPALTQGTLPPLPQVLLERVLAVLGGYSTGLGLPLGMPEQTSFFSASAP